MFDNRTGKPIEPELQPKIGVLEDPAIGCSGPLWVKGGIQVESESGNFMNDATVRRYAAAGIPAISRFATVHMRQ